MPRQAQNAPPVKLWLGGRFPFDQPRISFLLEHSIPDLRILHEEAGGKLEMIASIVTVRFDKATLDEAVEKYAHMQDTVVKYQPGWQSATLLIDRSTGDGVSVNFWESQDSAEVLFASETYKELTAHLAAHFQSTVERRIYEVVYRS